MYATAQRQHCEYSWVMVEYWMLCKAVMSQLSFLQKYHWKPVIQSSRCK